MLNTLEKSYEDIDDFFKPKNLKSREEKLEKERQTYVDKLKLGLSKIKSDYKNKESHSEFEKLFLELFSQLHVNEKYDEAFDGYFLKNNENETRCLLDLNYKEFSISYAYIWLCFEEKFKWENNEIKSFMENMLNEYFKFNEFTIIYSKWLPNLFETNISFKYPTTSTF